MSLPLHDWQFWAASALAIGSAWFLLRPFLPKRRFGGTCPGCPTGSAATKPKRTALTVDGRRVS